MQAVRIYVGGLRDSDAQERAALAAGLRRELLDVDVEDVVHPGIQGAPSGTKGSALEWTELIVTLAGTLPTVLMAVRSWQRRRQGTSVTLEVDGDRITLTDPEPDDQRALIDTWLKRHGSS